MTVQRSSAGSLEILNVDAILGKHRKLKHLKGGLDLFNDLFISTLEHKLSAKNRVEWSYMMVDGRTSPPIHLTHRLNSDIEI